VAELWLHGFPVIGNCADLARRAEAWGFSAGSGGHGVAPPDDVLDRFAVVGPPGLVRDRLAELLSLGLDHLVLVPGSRFADPDALERSDELVAGVLGDLP